MAITPPGDLLLDVMRAADPQRATAAARRLRALATASGGGPATTAWRDALQHMRQTRQAARAMPAPVAPDTAASPAAPLRLGKAPLPEQLRADGSPKPASEMSATTAAREPASTTFSRHAMADGAARVRLQQAYAGLEGVLVANMLDGMLSASRGGLFGGGLAGSYWKSLLARTVSEQVARAGGLGMADALLRAAPGASGRTAQFAAAHVAAHGMTGETT